MASERRSCGCRAARAGKSAAEVARATTQAAPQAAKLADDCGEVVYRVVGDAEAAAMAAQGGRFVKSTSAPKWSGDSTRVFLKEDQALKWAASEQADKFGYTSIVKGVLHPGTIEKALVNTDTLAPGFQTFYLNVGKLNGGLQGPAQLTPLP